MKHKNILITGIAVSLALFSSIALSPNQDKYAARVPDGLGFSDFKGYESWQLIAVSLSGDKLAPQAHDAKCGYACHTKVEKRDYVFTQYAPR